MKRFLFAVAVAFAATPVVIQTADAQPAAALGKPLPDGAMDAGTVSVRVVAGGPASPVVGADVTLLVGDQPRTARTDAQGRAMFPGLTAGATVQAKIKDAEGKDVLSDKFPVPSSGGARVMLTTKPFTGGGGGPAMGGGGGGGAGMPEPRKLSGQPRQDKETPAGSMVVRLSYNDLNDKEQLGNQLVSLVGFAADNSVIVAQQQSGPDGRAVFENLDMTGATGYFALAAMPRGTGVDRLFSLPTQLDGQAGYRVILSGEKRDSGAPNIDQLASQYAIATPPGKVRVTLEGFPSPNAAIRIVDAKTKAIVAQGAASVSDADPTTVKVNSSFAPRTDTPAGTLDIFVHGGPGEDAPLPAVEVRLIGPDGKTVDGTTVKTSDAGMVRLAVPIVSGAPPAKTPGAAPAGAPAPSPTPAPAPAHAEAGGKYVVMFNVLGREFASEPVDVAKAGGKLDIKAQWTKEGRPQAVFDVAFDPKQVLYAESTIDGKLAGVYRSMPFLPIASSGTHVGIIVYPRVIMKFNMRAATEDEMLGVQGRWTVENNSWIPYQDGPDGMLIPLPKGHRGGLIAEMNQSDVAVVPNEGFRILRPLPPGSGVSFIGGFTMAVDNGTVDWRLDLPYGSVASDIHFRQIPGMTVRVPENVRGQVKQGKDGSPYYMVEQITIPRGKSMTLSVHGLPSPPLWKVWAPRVIGVAVVLLILAGIGVAIATGSRGKVAGAQSTRKAALLDELVDLERSGRDPRRREQVVAELEKLWDA